MIPRLGVFVTADTSHLPPFISSRRAPPANTTSSTSRAAITQNIHETPAPTKRLNPSHQDTAPCALLVKTGDMEFPTNLHAATSDDAATRPQAEPEPSKNRVSKKRKNDDDDDDEYIEVPSSDEGSEAEEDVDMGSGSSEAESGGGSGGSGLVESEDEASEEQAAINSPPKKDVRPTSSVSVEVARHFSSQFDRLSGHGIRQGRR